jgi:hypothetical protein
MTYNTTDITMAAYFKCKGYSLSSVTMEGTKGTFHFDDVKPDDLMEYMSGNATVEPVSFHTAVRALSKLCRVQ